jgi:hypothetical protein
MRRALTLAAAPLVAVALAACGGIDDEDPEAVARALADAIYRCDQPDIDRLRELTLASETEALDGISPAKDNCGGASPEITGIDHDPGEPEEPPPLELVAVVSGPTQQIHRVRQLADGYGSSDEGYIVLVHDDDPWRWSPATNLDESDLSG